MGKVEKIKAEIERRKSLADKEKENMYFFARSDAYRELLNFIDSLEEESDCIYNHTPSSSKYTLFEKTMTQKDDEKIRNVLLNDFKNHCSEYYCEGVNRDMIFAWLEKQGEPLKNDG